MPATEWLQATTPRNPGSRRHENFYKSEQAEKIPDLREDAIRDVS
jgi:hypothetical protein